ncbi:MAG: M20 family metallopeptidase [Candidatus Melainabacteria bacterium]|nr:M20 family metallopeptidase [Candidatus Melainabacteria bacterium]
MTSTTRETLTATELYAKAKEIKADLVRYRRHIHANPELSFEEVKTAEYVAETLKKFGLKPTVGVGGTGVVVDIGEGETVVIRADMDALPIQELNEMDHCSKNKGVMHACGHDVHTACALGAAQLLAANPPKNGRIRVIFQPAEEATNGDGLSGASLMMNDGALEGAKRVVALHVFPELATGKIALRSGPLLAACDKFDIKIQGKGTHGAWPELGVDSVVVACQIVQAIQTIVSRRISALDAAVITIGGIKSSTYRSNIVADSVELTGTVRYFAPETHVIVKRELENACSIANIMGGSYELHYITENPAVNNDPYVVAVVDQVASEMIGKENIEEATMKMGAEDFSFLSEKYPSCFVCLGVQVPGPLRFLHTATFDANEDALPLGAALLASSALALL